MKEVEIRHINEYTIKNGHSKGETFKLHAIISDSDIEFFVTNEHGEVTNEKKFDLNELTNDVIWD